MSNNDGGQAFPTHPILYGSADQHMAQGMSLRDWFAGQALAGIMGPNYDWFTSGSSETGSRTYEAAFFAYGLADTMLAARNSTPTKES